MEYPTNAEDSMKLFRHRMAEYRRGDSMPFWKISEIILTHAGTCDVEQIFAELPPDLQDHMLESSLSATVPRDELINIQSHCPRYGAPRPPSDPEVLAASKLERERQLDLEYLGICKFYEFSKNGASWDDEER